MVPDAYATPGAFSATLRADDGTERIISLTGPVDAPDHDRRLMPAYELRVVPQLDGRDGIPFVQYLDADLRVIVNHRPCGVAKDCTNESEWSWQGHRGHVPMYGIGYLFQLYHGTLASIQGRSSVEYPSTLTSFANGTIRLDVERMHIHPARVGNETWWYEEGRMLPNGPHGSVVEYENRGPLSGAARLDGLLDIPPYKPWQGLMFADETQDHYQIGVSHRGIIEQAYPGIGNAASPCVIEYSLTLDSSANDSPPLLPQMGEDEIAEALVVLTNGSRTWHTEVVVFRSRWDGSVRLEASSAGEHDDPPRDCEDLRKSPWPSVTLEKARAFVREMNLSTIEDRGFTHSVSPKTYFGRNASRGGHEWQFDFIPAYVSGQSSYFVTAYSAHIEPIAETPLQYLYTSPDDEFWAES